MTAPERRTIGQWDETDHVTFALAGLMRLASRAQADLLYHPHWVEGYPQRLADELDAWVRKIRAGHIYPPDEQGGHQPMKHDILVLALLINAVAILVVAAAILAANGDAAPDGRPAAGLESETRP